MIYRKTRVRSWRQRSTSQHMETVCKRFPNPNKRHFNSNTISWTTDACDLVDGWVVYSTNNQPSFKPAANMCCTCCFSRNFSKKKSIHLIIPVSKLQNSLETNLTRKKKSTWWMAYRNRCTKASLCDGNELLLELGPHRKFTTVNLSKRNQFKRKWIIWTNHWFSKHMTYVCCLSYISKISYHIILD